MNCDVIDDSANGGDSTGLEHKILSGRGRSRTQKKATTKITRNLNFFLDAILSKKISTFFSRFTRVW